MTAQNPGADAGDRARADRLLDISRLMLAFKDVESSVDLALAVAATTLPLRTAILLDASGPTPRIHRWPALEEAGPQLAEAENHARAAYDMLVGQGASSRLDLDQRTGATALPVSAPEFRAPGDVASRFIALPLLLKSDQIFGLLQIEAAERLERSDVTFVSTMTDMFALAIDRLRSQRQAQTADERVREQLAITNAMADSLVEGVVACDAEGRITFFNHAACAMLGRDQAATMGASINDVLMIGDAFGMQAELPLVRALRTRAPVLYEELMLFRSDGAGFVASMAAAPIFRDAGLAGAVLAFSDVTEARRARQARALLLEAEGALSRGLEVHAVLQALAGVVLPTLGDLCELYVLAPGDQVDRAAWAHRDDAGKRAMDQAYRGAPSTSLPHHAIGRAVAAKATELVHDVDERWLTSLVDAEHAGVLRSFKVRSALIVPIFRGARPLGALCFFCAGSGRRFHQKDVELAEELARRTSLAIENSQLYADARRAVRTRDQILEVVAHDLKNPLNAILMGVEADRRRQKIDASAARLATLERIESAAARMRRLVDDLLDYASMDAGTLSIELGDHDVAPLVQEALVSVEIEAKRRGLLLSSRVAPDVPKARCDPQRLLQVLGNLLGNAVKITPLGGAIVVTAERDGASVKLAVADTGPGIDPAQVPHLFERFWRAEGVAYKGTGLGLAICKAIVDAHGGSIKVDSELGKGAVFTVSLPAVPR